jgi:hypothetical protein
MELTNREDAHCETLDAWQTNAPFWDERMGEGGNDFVNIVTNLV